MFTAKEGMRLPSVILQSTDSSLTGPPLCTALLQNKDADGQIEKGMAKQLFGVMSYSQGRVETPQNIQEVVEPSVEIWLQSRTALPGILGLLLSSCVSLSL